MGAFIMGKHSPKTYNYTKNDLANVLNPRRRPPAVDCWGAYVLRATID